MSNNATADKITQTVIDEYSDKISDKRLRELVCSLVGHLHQFVQDVQLTEEEWGFAMDYLARTGQICSDERQEFVLLSDILGVSMVLDAVNWDKKGIGTENTVLGPFYVPGAPEMPNGSSFIRTEEPQAEVAFVRGKVLNPRGKPIANAKLDIWSTAGNALYHMQDPEAPKFNMCGVLHTEEDGSYCFVTEVPQPYSIPNDGPVGELLNVCNRHSMRPAHIHIIATADGYEKLQTHIFANIDPYLSSDAVFATKDELIAEFKPSSDPELAQKYNLPDHHRVVDLDLVLIDNE